MTHHIQNAALGTILASALAFPAVAQEGQPIAVQMYTLRDLGTLEEQLQAVEDAGVTAIETVGTQEVSAEELNSMLDEHGIEVVSSHVQLATLRNELDEAVAFNKAIGNDTITVPYLPEDQRPTDAAGWQELGEELGGIAAELAEEDMRLGYHNHDFEMVDYDGQTALEIMFEAAGPDVLAQIDLAWVDRGGHDPAEYLRTIGDRVFAVHAKDNAPDGENEDQRGFAAVGAGTLDWPGILDAAQEVGVEWYIIEHDLPADAAGVIAEGADFLREELPAHAASN